MSLWFMIKSYTADISFWNDTLLFFWWQVFENEALDTFLPENLQLIFNIHVCCLSNPMSTEFIDRAKSFNLVQSMKEPTHCEGHIINLVFSSGFCLDDIDIVDILF